MTFEKIRDWAIERGLDVADRSKQVIKLTEEVGELASAYLRKDKEKLKDSIGDIVVVLIILSQQHDLRIEWCIEEAYQEIKDRQGKMVDGCFVKSEDLKDGENK